eukprot:g47930.t1
MLLLFPMKAGPGPGLPLLDPRGPAPGQPRPQRPRLDPSRKRKRPKVPWLLSQKLERGESPRRAGGGGGGGGGGCVKPRYGSLSRYTRPFPEPSGRWLLGPEPPLLLGLGLGMEDETSRDS